MPDFRALPAGRQGTTAKPDEGIAIAISRRDERFAAENMVIAVECGFIR